MQARLTHAACALVAALALAGCGADDDPESGGAPRDGQYAGQTSQGLPISFVVVGSTVRDIHFGWRAKCNDGEVHVNTIALPGGGLVSSSFASGGRLETGGIARVNGSFDGEQFAGELSRSKGSAFGTNCRATGIGWNAGYVADAPRAAPEAPADGVSS